MLQRCRSLPTLPCVLSVSYLTLLLISIPPFDLRLDAFLNNGCRYLVFESALFPIPNPPFFSNCKMLSTINELPPLPQYELRPLPFLVPPIPDKLLLLLLPIAAYWILSMIFHWIDTKDYFSQYRLHTPAEVLKRNHVSRWDVVRDVVIQQVIQTLVGAGLGMFEPDDFHGKDDYNVSAWALRLRKIQLILPGLLSLVGIDAPGLAEKVAESYPVLAGAIRGGIYPFAQDLVTLANGQQALVPAFCGWEIILAKTLYWYAIPALQFGVAILFVDTWQYFMHRAFHMNKWLYSKLSI